MILDCFGWSLNVVGFFCWKIFICCGGCDVFCVMIFFRYVLVLIFKV